jgi:photosystem II stability/assembly factor-like uncharacterized protein
VDGVDVDVLIGTRKGLFRLAGEGAGVPKPLGFLGVPVTSVLRDPRDGAIYAGLDHGHFGVKLHRSEDDGATWKELPAPAYPAKGPDEVDVNPMTQRPLEWTTKLLWTLEAGHADDPDALWCGTIPGGLFRSPDRGETWSLVRSLWDRPERKHAFGGGYDDPGLHSISIDPRDRRRMVVATSCGGTWLTDDGGDSWELGTGMTANFVPPELGSDPAIQDPHRVVRCAAEPDVMWAQHHCGIFRSTDGGRTWSDIGGTATPSAFGFPVAAHPTDPDTAWFTPAESDEVRIPIGGRMTVSRTRDGGRTYDELSRGLPQEGAYHLVYRHCMDVSTDGERLVLGSTTGSLWIGEGVSGEVADAEFRLVTSSLPPILALRAAQR